MPDAKCDKCKKTLGDICTTDITHKNLKNLINKRASRLPLVGTIINISPGICHNEVDKDADCDGVLWYKPLMSTPPGVEW
jgi:hypothetical protein